MLSFLPGTAAFALAGLVCAAGPVLIHLLNRRRFRVLDWGAMDFLLEAVRRNRRILQLRDWLLLALRTLAVALFGLALARPFFAFSKNLANPNAPLHAILVLDNSMSMGAERLGGATLLDEAKSRAREFLADLPEGSRVSVLPLCGSAFGFSLDAYRSLEDAREAIERLDLVDRAGSGAIAVDLARQASGQVPELPSKRIVFIGDQQLLSWPAGSAELLKDIGEMQVVSVPKLETENTWIESFELVDNVADVETPALFSAVVRHEGAVPRGGVQVTLTVDGVDVGAQTVDLQPGQQREVTFPYRFDASAEPNRPTYVPAKVSIPADRLPQDDARYLVAPVVAALPVVFVDQYGADENPRRNRYGETLHLRRLLAPIISRGEAPKQLVEVRHVKIEQLDRALLADTRLVVIAGVQSPETAVPLLGEFVAQGGQLMICAGADFDPSGWTQTAWLDGAGILPAPLKNMIGQLPEDARELRPFFLNYESLKDQPAFHLAGVEASEQADLYAEPLFFKAVETELGEAMLASFVEAETKRLSALQARQATWNEQLRRWSEQAAKGPLPAAEEEARQRVQEEQEAVTPSWLVWPERDETPSETPSVAQQVEQGKPRLLASFDNNVPFLIERRIGRGRVLWVSTGMFSQWNTLPKTNAMLALDRILRGMLQATLARRTLDSNEPLTLSVAENDRYSTLRVTRPSGTTETLSVDALGANHYGVTVRGVVERGIYTIAATKPDLSNERGEETKLWSVPVAVNGASRESEQAVLDRAGFESRVGQATNVRWVSPGEKISLSGGAVRGQDLWWWCLLAVLACLLAEFAVLAWPQLARERSVAR